MIMRYGIKNYILLNVQVPSVNRILNGAEVTNRHNPADGIKFKCMPGVKSLKVFVGFIFILNIDQANQVCICFTLNSIKSR